MKIINKLLSRIEVQKFCGHCGHDFQSVIENKVHCLICGHENRDGSKCCSNCGSSLQAPILLTNECPECGVKANEYAKFCDSCGCKTTLKKAICNSCGNEIMVKKRHFFLFKRKLNSESSTANVWQHKKVNHKMSNQSYILTVLSLIMILILLFYILGYLNSGVGQLICSALCSFILTTKNIGNLFS